MSFFEILPCPLDDLQQALRVLHAGLCLDQQGALVATLDQLQSRDTALSEGLFVARSASQIVAAAWVQRVGGNSAIFWPPEFASPAALPLMQRVDQQLAAWRVPLTQLVASRVAAADEQLLAVAGFKRLVDLDYLSLEAKHFAKFLKSAQTEPYLAFLPHAADYPERLQSLILATYLGSLDCPQYMDLREPADVLASYRDQGDYRGENWLLIATQSETDPALAVRSQDVGVLLLAEHAAARVLELVYMGIVPEVRGRRFGEEILRYAVRRAEEIDVERVVLAVDTQNHPAQDMYRRAGFAPWDCRTVYARIPAPE